MAKVERSLSSLVLILVLAMFLWAPTIESTSALALALFFFMAHEYLKQEALKLLDKNQIDILDAKHQEMQKQIDTLIKAANIRKLGQ